MNWEQIKSGAVYALGLGGAIVGAITPIPMSTGVHVVLVAAGGVIVAVERYVQGSTAKAVAVAKAAAAAKEA